MNVIERLLSWLNRLLNRPANSLNVGKPVQKSEQNEVKEDTLPDLKNIYSGDLKVAVESLAGSIVDVFKDHGQEVSDIGKQYADKLKDAGIQVVAGTLTWDQFKDLSENYWMAARSELLTRGLQAKAQMVEKLVSGAINILGVGVKMLVAI